MSIANDNSFYHKIYSIFFPLSIYYKYIGISIYLKYSVWQNQIPIHD